MRYVPATLATVLGLFGCNPAHVSRAEFVRQGNAICAGASARVDRLVAPRPTAASTPVAVAGYVDAYVAELRQELAELRLLGYPPGERRRVRSAYDALDAVLTAAERDPLSFRAASLGPAAERLREAGLTACEEASKKAGRARRR